MSIGLALWSLGISCLLTYVLYKSLQYREECHRLQDELMQRRVEGVSTYRRVV